MNWNENLPPVSILPREVFPARGPLAGAFALRLGDRRGVSSRSSYQADEVYNEPPVEDLKAVLSLRLPQAVLLEGLHCGILVFDFSANSDFCGGELPRRTEGPPDAAFQAAETARHALVIKRTRYINAFLATLSVGGQQANTGIGPQVPLNLGNYHTADTVEGTWRVQGPGAAAPMEGWPSIAVYLPGDLFRNAAAVFEKIYAVFGLDTFELLPLLQDCAAHFQNHQFSAASVIGWSVAEAVLSRRWRCYVAAAGSHTALPRRRLDRLNGKDFTASIIIEALSLAGRLKEQHRETLDIARRARNKFAHELIPPIPGQSFLAASVAAQMIGEEAGCDFRVSSGYTYQT